MFFLEGKPRSCLIHPWISFYMYQLIKAQNTQVACPVTELLMILTFVCQMRVVTFFMTKLSKLDIQALNI